MRNLPTHQTPATPTSPNAAISGRLLAADASPAEALSELRQCFNELAKHQEFIAMAWIQRYGVELETIDPMNARMNGAIGQVSAMICMVENQLKILERANQAVQCAALSADHNSLTSEAQGVSHV